MSNVKYNGTIYGTDQASEVKYGNSNVADALLNVETNLNDVAYIGDSATGAIPNDPAVLNTIDVVDNLGSSATQQPLSANQGRILNNKINNLPNTLKMTATKIEYDNSASRLEATNLQTALDEVTVKMNNVAATSVAYDNSVTNLNATNIQDAIDEMLDTVNGIILTVPQSTWIKQADNTYKNSIAVNGISETDVMDVSLYGDNVTDQEAEIFDEWLTAIDFDNNKIILYSSQQVPISFKIVLRGRTNIELGKDTIEAGQVSYNNEGTVIQSTNLQDVISEIGNRTFITLNCVTDDKMIGETVTCSKDGISFSAVVPKEKKIIFKLPSAGRWVIHNPATGRDKIMDITYYGEYDVDLRGYAVYSAIIDHSIADPRDSITYADDAIGMEKGSLEWLNKPIFKDIKPCLLIEGVFAGYLNKDTMTSYENGNSADITTLGNDVMVEFPRMGYRFKWLDDNKLKISITDEPNNSEFYYDAFSFNDYNDCDKIYLAAYEGFVSSTKLYSSHNRAVTVSLSKANYRSYAQARGGNFGIRTFASLKLLQCLYLIWAGDLDSQTALGYGNLVSGAYIKTGTANNYGFMSEIVKNSNPTYITDGKHAIKFLGIENPYGNYWEIIDGVRTDSVLCLLTSKRHSRNNNSGYNYFNSGNYEKSSGLSTAFINKVIGDNYGGFLPMLNKGSATTYYTDQSAYTANRHMLQGRSQGGGTAGGIFSMDLSYEDLTWTSVTARLMYYHKEVKGE